MNKKRKPFKVVKNVSIVDVAENGRGVGKTEDYVVFVKDAVPGDKVDVRLLKKKKSYAEGDIVSFHHYSPLRTEPLCKHFKYCGGCKRQNMLYERQLEFKQDKVKMTFEKIAGMKNLPIHDIISAEDTFYYRNKLEFTFSSKRWLIPEEIKSKKTFDHYEGLGFHVQGFFDKVIDIQECHLQVVLSNAIRNEIRKYTLQGDLPYYNIRTHEGFLRNLILRNNAIGQFMVVLVVNYEDNDAIERIGRLLEEKFSDVTSFYQIINNKKNSDISDLEPVHVFGEHALSEQLFDITFRIGPKSFFQTNIRQTVNLYQAVLNFLGKAKDKTVYDLYCGIGSISLVISKHAGKVVGIEYISEAVSDAELNAKENNISNVSFHSGDIAKIWDDNFTATYGLPDIVITDPPRAGMHKDVISQLFRAAPEKIIYVSCNPATQARDIKMLEAEYVVKALQPVDMFPHTDHVENVALLVHRNYVNLNTVS